MVAGCRGLHSSATGSAQPQRLRASPPRQDQDHRASGSELPGFVPNPRDKGSRAIPVSARLDTRRCGSHRMDRRFYSRGLGRLWPRPLSAGNPFSPNSMIMGLVYPTKSKSTPSASRHGPTSRPPFQSSMGNATRLSRQARRLSILSCRTKHSHATASRFTMYRLRTTKKTHCMS